MEMNNFTRMNEVCADVVIHRDMKTIELSNDYILPDYLADIKSVLYIKPAIHRNSRIVSDGKLEYDGELTYSVVFITEDEKIRSAIFDEAYNGSIAVEGINDENCTALILPVIGDLQWKLSNPRKLNIKTMLNLDISIQCNRCIMPRITGKHTIENEMTLERLEDDISFIKCRMIDDNDVSISEDIVLDSSYPNISEILVCTLDSHISDVRSVGGKLTYRGEILASCLFTSAAEDDSEHYHTVTKKIPIEGDLEFNSELQKDRCRWKIITERPKAAARNNEFEEKRIIELDFTYDLQMICCTNETARCVTDSYSVDCEYKNSFVTFDILKEIRQIGGSVSINETLDVQELHDDHTGEIISASASLKNISTAYDSQKGRIICTGDITFDFCIQIDEKSPKVVTFTRPIRFEADGDSCNDLMYITADASVVKLKCRTDDSHYYTDAEIGYIISAEERRTEKTLESVELNVTDHKASKGGAYPITLYYPRENESLWDIAKKYNTTTMAIRSANDLADDNISSMSTLVIPRGTLKPVYSKLI